MNIEDFIPNLQGKKLILLARNDGILMLFCVLVFCAGDQLLPKNLMLGNEFLSFFSIYSGVHVCIYKKKGYMNIYNESHVYTFFVFYVYKMYIDIDFIYYLSYIPYIYSHEIYQFSVGFFVVDFRNC